MSDPVETSHAGDPNGRVAERRAGRAEPAAERAMPVRAEDLEPYIELRYIAKLFRVIAILLLILLVAEVVRGLYVAGTGAIPTLLAEGSRLLLFAGLLWGAGDLAILLIDIGHDVRATRILLGRQAAHHLGQEPLPPPNSARRRER